jgi:hypothetical protein
MADPIVIHSGRIGTRGLHVYPGETPTADWASVMADNVGLIRGNYQNHMQTWSRSVTVSGTSQELMTRFCIAPQWPPLGSYCRIAYTIRPTKNFYDSVVTSEYMWNYIYFLDETYETLGDLEPGVRFATIAWQSRHQPNNSGGDQWDSTRFYVDFTADEIGLWSYPDERLRIEIWGIPTKDDLPQSWDMYSLGMYCSAVPLAFQTNPIGD